MRTGTTPSQKGHAAREEAHREDLANVVGHRPDLVDLHEAEHLEKVVALGVQVARRFLLVVVVLRIVGIEEFVV